MMFWFKVFLLSPQVLTHFFVDFDFAECWKICAGCSKILEDCDKRNVDDDIPMFRTGFGSSVVIKKSSIAKASAVLGDDCISKFDTG